MSMQRLAVLQRLLTRALLSKDRLLAQRVMPERKAAQIQDRQDCYEALAVHGH